MILVQKTNNNNKNNPKGLPQELYTPKYNELIGICELVLKLVQRFIGHFPQISILTLK